MTFNEAPVVVAGVTFTNWPEASVQTSDDDLWNIDRTQLGRNAASTALIAYAMANASDETAPALIAETVGRGINRLANNLRLALSWLADADDLSAAYHLGVEQLVYVYERERRALTSLGEVSNSTARRVPELLAGLDHRDRKSTRLNSSHVAISYAVY